LKSIDNKLINKKKAIRQQQYWQTRFKSHPIGDYRYFEMNQILIIRHSERVDESKSKEERDQWKHYVSPVYYDINVYDIN
jgi:hypothetical protein